MTRPAARDYSLLALLSPQTRRQRVRMFEDLRQAGHAEVVVFMVQQILEFERQGKEFAMKYAGAEDEMLQVLEDAFASMPLERRLKCPTTEERLQGLSPEDRLKGMTPEEFERLKQLVQEQARVDDNAHPK